MQELEINHQCSIKAKVLGNSKAYSHPKIPVPQQPTQIHSRDNWKLRPGLKIKYIFNRTEITFEDRARDLLNTGKILLKLAYQINGDIHAFGVFSNNGQLEWKQILITYTYCSE
jgi:hypothetical protein